MSSRFDDPYYSLENGLAEARHVFLRGNGLPKRLADGFHVAELGFGTGLNFLETLRVWRSTGRRGRIRFTSFEAYPLHRQDMERALERFSDADLPTAELLAQWQPGGGVFHFGADAVLEAIVGDARMTLPRWAGCADAWYLDGFSPAKNPEMWSAELMAEVALHCNEGATFATYTAAGHVRRSLQEAGFHVERTAGYGRKRHMCRGYLG